ncbi:MAG: Outer-membrane lipoprotein LolB [Paracidovorax wautersii]|uniref:Outer-membrane lipoprotein LolB n=1 Tax=Paracidovorax wautersii TaxID=1177982 RepID=A0A7V8JP45_9BURK|nr:MAG: Outer-membrane lipoprotein LolB [Paracidovorax wautersii]
MQRRAALAALAGAAAGLLAACATPTRTLPVTADSYWLGRLSLQLRTERAQGFAAGFELSGRPDRGELVLTSPVGTRIAEVHWTAQEAVLEQGGRRQAYASLDELITRLTGTAIPVPALFDWLQGKATAVDGWSVDLSRQPEGRLSAVRQWPEPVADLRIVIE